MGRKTWKLDLGFRAILIVRRDHQEIAHASPMLCSKITHQESLESKVSIDAKTAAERHKQQNTSLITFSRGDSLV